MGDEEKDDVKQLFLYEASYLDKNDGAIFSVADRERLREREIAMMERNSQGYYCCKIKYAASHQEMTNDLARFLVPDMMSILQHDWSTQINEAMNQSVASYAPKNKPIQKVPLSLFEFILLLQYGLLATPRYGVEYLADLVLIWMIIYVIS